MAFVKGQSGNPAGRQKGSSNKNTALLKDAILMAADAAHPEGMVGYLTQQAASNPAAFMTLLGKVLPTQIAGDPDNPLNLVSEIKVRFVSPGDQRS